MSNAFAAVKKWTAGRPSILADRGRSVLWLFGLSDQLADPMQAAKYVGISLLMVAVAVI